MVAAEVAPFAKTGGLGDVLGSLPRALREEDVDVRVIMPEYQTIDAKYRQDMRFVRELTVPVGWREQYCGLKTLEHDGVPVYFLDSLYYFDRPQLYGYLDEAERFAFFNRAVLEALPYLDFSPKILHCHDWHTGMIGPLLDAHYRSRSDYSDLRTMFTIHNLKYQGVFPKTILGEVLDLGWEYFTPDRVEFYDQVSFMKGGLAFSDLITTVSRSYAEEIQTPFFGEHLDSFLSQRGDRLHGIVNGIDSRLYDPATDPWLYQAYGPDPFPKQANKSGLQETLGLPVAPDVPLLAIVGRLVSQKGLDLVACLLEEILALDLQLVVLGTGEEHYQQLFQQAAERHPQQVAVSISFNDILARRIYAGADLLLMPSLFEPCGISQLIAMRYGTIPIVRETGGLKDTVKSYNEETRKGNGFSFANYNAHDMLYTIRRAITIYRDYPTWLTIVGQAMASDFSWARSARRYAALYQKMTSRGGSAWNSVKKRLNRNSSTS